MAETETKAKPDGTPLAAVIGGKPAKVGDPVRWRGAPWRLEDDGDPITHNRATVKLKGYDGVVPVREVSRVEEPEPAPKAKPPASTKLAGAPKATTTGSVSTKVGP